jgi:cobalt-zinc-cadmium resistance protein CzcA
MAMTFSFAVIGAMILCLTYVPMVSAFFMSRKPSLKEGWGDKFIHWLVRIYEPILQKALKRKTAVLSIAVAFSALAFFTFSRMGGEFIPKLDEGDIAMQALLKPGSSLEETEKVSSDIEKVILENFPEVTEVLSRIGVAELPTDPMPMDIADMFIMLKPQDEWVSAETKEELIDKIKEKLSFLPGVNYEFSQPLELRFNELMTGVRQDVAIKLFGDDLDLLASYAQKMAGIIATVQGVADIKVEATKGLPQMTVQYERSKLARYGLNVQELNTIVRTAFSGEIAGVIFEGEKRFDLVVRLKEEHKKSIEDLRNIYISLPDGQQLPIREVANVSYQPGPMQISREGTNRRTYVGINVRKRDVESVVNEIQEKLDAQLDLPPGYYLKYGGSFENLQRAKARLVIVVPIALLLIFVLLYFALKSFSQTIMIYIAIPLAASGGIFSLWLRDMPFSISAGVGFIVLFGVAVLNGLVLISSMNDLKQEGLGLKERILKGTKERIRPIFLTASTDILGFLPMAISSSAGAEVQRPLATVVIGGLMTASLLTLIIIPILYNIIESRKERKAQAVDGSGRVPKIALLLLIPLIGSFQLFGQTSNNSRADTRFLTIDEAVSFGLESNESIQSAGLEVERLKTLRKTSFEIGKTDFGVQYGQYNSFENDFAFSIDQNFQFPTVYSNQKALAKANISSGEYLKLITENDLVNEIKLAWYQLANLQEISKLLAYQDSVYVQFLRAAELRYETEAAALLEKVTAESRVTSVKAAIAQNRANIIIYQKRLQTLLNSPGPVGIVQDFEPKKELILELDTALVSTNPNLAFFFNLIEVREKTWTLEKAKIAPEFSIGYFNQSLIGYHEKDGTEQYYDNGQRFTGVQASISIPIWAKPDAARIKAAKIHRQQAETDASYYQSLLFGEYERVVQDYLKYSTMIDYYENNALPQADLILSNSKKSFENGAIDYVEYIQGLDNGLSIKSSYLDFLNQYNQSIIAIEYLAGKK